MREIIGIIEVAKAGTVRPFEKSVASAGILSSKLNAGLNRSTASRLAFDGHVRSCETKNSTLRRSVGDGNAPMAKIDDENSGVWRSAGAGCRAERFGEELLIAMLRVSLADPLVCCSGPRPHIFPLSSNDSWVRRSCADAYLYNPHLFSVVSYWDLLLDCQHNLSRL